jgi:predicted transposase YbfD/YdcC
MGQLASSAFQDYFATLTDPRCPYAPNSRHLLMDILFIAVCAVIGSADGWEDLEAYGHAHAAWCADLLELPHGMPRHDTLRRVLAQLDADELTRCFLAWTEALREVAGGEVVSIEGKTLRRSFDRSPSTATIQMVSAWASAHRLVLGHVKVEEKSNEITAMPKLLARLELTGAVVTIDAMGCQKAIAQTLMAQGADYVLALTKNHQQLYADMTLFLDDAQASGFAGVDHAYSATGDGEMDAWAYRNSKWHFSAAPSGAQL